MDPTCLQKKETKKRLIASEFYRILSAFQIGNQHEERQGKVPMSSVSLSPVALMSSTFKVLVGSASVAIVDTPTLDLLLSAQQWRLGSINA